TVKKAAMRRAVGWHRRALVGAAGLSRKKIESRIAEWEALNPPLPHGEWVDLLPFIDLKKSPSWSWKGQAVGVFIDTQWPKLNVPVIPEGSYDLRVKVVLTNGGDQILFRMPVGEGVVVASLVGREGLHRLMADGEALLGSTFATNVNLPSGQEVVFDASVVVSGERAVVTGSVDGKLVMRWEGAISSLPRNALSEHDRMCLRLDGGTNRLWFNAVQIRIRDGRVRLGTE
ncbi:MAG TPA: hypothetical protein VGE52_08215, partial [Pirellulales bacterium]